MATKATELNKAKLQWGRRKKGKEEELEEGRRARQESRQLLGEEELAAMDLANQVHFQGSELSIFKSTFVVALWLTDLV